MTRRTLILACSATKRKDPGQMSALARYDGPAWRTLRANMSCSIEPPLALSAAFGLISVYEEIPDYDQRMSYPPKLNMIRLVSGQLAELARRDQLGDEILAFGGLAYRETLRLARDHAALDFGRHLPQFQFTSGGIGEQLGQLKAWLRREA